MIRILATAGSALWRNGSRAHNIFAIWGLAEADDLVVWEYARAHDLVIVTQDSDYADWNKVRGAPPEIGWLRCGNTTVTDIQSKLRLATEQIPQLEHEAQTEVAEI